MNDNRVLDQRDVGRGIEREGKVWKAMAGFEGGYDNKDSGKWVHQACWECKRFPGTKTGF